MLLPSVTVFHAHIYCVTISLSLSLSLVVEFGVANLLFEHCDGKNNFESDSLVYFLFLFIYLFIYLFFLFYLFLLLKFNFLTFGCIAPWNVSLS